MTRPSWPFRRRGADPGPDWAAAALGPLRRLDAAPDVAPAVMARIRALALAPGATAPRRRLAWAFFAGAAAGAILTGGLVIAALRDPGIVAQAYALAAGCVRWLWQAAAFLLGACHHLGGFALGLLSAIEAILNAFAPALQGAAWLAAACGAAAIGWSLHTYAHALRAAPARTPEGGTR